MKTNKEKLSNEHLNLLRNSLLFSLSRRGWSGFAKVKRREQEEKVITNSSNDRLGVTKRLIRCKEFDAIQEHMGAIYTWCQEHSMPAIGRKGCLFVKREFDHDGEVTDMVARFEEEIQSSKDELRNNLVPAFLEVYPQAKLAASLSKAQGGLGDLYLESDYPTVEELEESFGIEHYWFALSVPDELPEEVRNRENKKLVEWRNQAMDEIRSMLRSLFNDLLGEAVERLTSTGSYDGKAFRNDSLNKFETFINTFNAKDITDDSELKGLVSQARQLIRQVPDAGIIRDHAKLASVMADKFKEVKQVVAGMVVDKPSRRFAVE